MYVRFLSTKTIQMKWERKKKNSEFSNHVVHIFFNVWNSLTLQSLYLIYLRFASMKQRRIKRKNITVICFWDVFFSVAFSTTLGRPNQSSLEFLFREPNYSTIGHLLQSITIFFNLCVLIFKRTRIDFHSKKI